ncbi:MrpH family fimbial adhesin [Xenorhabdus littoralis]|uniref:MrpH family fimbial adhesin n=1 Tax=Xenorhabdus littoralis TaxID=2582835 RepID=UPI0029E81348|nr:pilus assembly protein [Xenorhabdus sp. psl]MDX7991029.1 pilus assembly protein [Xenorhabdus sp. psl]
MYYIKKSLLKLAALLFLFSATYVYGGAYVMPVNTVKNGDKVTTTMEIVAWTEEKGIPNPCYGKQRKCSVGPDVQYFGHQPAMHGSCVLARVCLNNANEYETTAEVMEAYKKFVGIGRPVTFDILSEDSKCIGLFYTYNDEIGGGGKKYGSAQQFPNSVCSKMPPINQSCEITVPTEIRYGELIASEVNNSKHTVIGTLTCTSPSSKIHLRAISNSGEPKVYFDDNRQIYATLQINDQDAENGINVIARKSEATIFTLTSTLHTITLPKASKYEGTAVVLLTFL